MNAPTLVVTVLTVVSVASVVAVVVFTLSRDVRRNAMWAAAHEVRLSRWTVTATVGRGDAPPPQPRALPSGRQPVAITASGEVAR